MEFDIDKRKESRTPHRGIVIMPYGAGEQLAFEEASLVDCSPGGVGIQLRRPLRVGDPFLLKLKRPRVLLALYTVRHCRSWGPEQYVIGAEFGGVILGPGEAPVGSDVVYEALLGAGGA